MLYWTKFVGALAYADDIVLLCSTAAAMRTFLLVSDAFASEIDVKFNALKSKLLVYAEQSLQKNQFLICHLVSF